MMAYKSGRRNENILAGRGAIKSIKKEGKTEKKEPMSRLVEPADPGAGPAGSKTVT